jgi:hypothetical protein
MFVYLLKHFDSVNKVPFVFLLLLYYEYNQIYYFASNDLFSINPLTPVSVSSYISYIT